MALPTTVLDVLKSAKVLGKVLLVPEIEAILQRLKIVTEAGSDAIELDVVDESTRKGFVAINGGAADSPLPGLDLSLELPTGIVKPAPCKLALTPDANDPTGFAFWVVISKQGQAGLAFKPLERIPGLALTAATVKPTPGGGELVPIPGQPALVVAKSQGSELGPALLIAAGPGERAHFALVADTDKSKGDLVALGFETETVVFGTSGLGVGVKNLTYDDSSTAVAPDGPGAPSLVPPVAKIAADDQAWKGIVARQLDFYLPPSVPVFGGRPLRGYFEAPRGGGPQVVAETTIPAEGKRPKLTVRIECRDPAARGFSGLVPTLISVSADFELNAANQPADSGGVVFASGKPIRLTATIARDPLATPQAFSVAIAASAVGGEGLISVDGETGAVSRSFNFAALMATALFGGPDGSPTALALVAAVGEALSSLFKPKSKFVLHGAELAATRLPLEGDGRFQLVLDYSVSAAVRHISLPGGGIGVEMKEANPLRIRMRGVRLAVVPGASGLAMFDIDFAHAEAEVENPGAWDLEGLKDLFDILGSRSGRGSTWIEVDLGFKLDLGPVKVTKATLRATIDKDRDGDGLPDVDVGISGLAASLDVPGVLSGSGSLRIEKEGFGASLAASVIPLNLTAVAAVAHKASMTALALRIDLPSPVPLANSGFGLLGIGGAFAANGEPDYTRTPTPNLPVPPDPILKQLYWQPVDETSFTEKAGQVSLGFEIAIGTLPDLGFAFSAKAGLIIAFPDFSLRFALNGRVLQPAVSMTTPSYPPGKGVSFIGSLLIDPDEVVDVAVMGSVDLRPLLRITIPVVGHFPIAGNAADWYVHLGADGLDTDPGRSIGPITAEVLPGFLDIRGTAYLMIRGNGITAAPPGRPGAPTNASGFVIAFGFAFRAPFGPKPVAWAELHASLDLVLGFELPIVAGIGTAGGSLHLGPFSIGVEAQLRFLAVGSDDKAVYIHASVTARIELLFYDIEGTVTIKIGETKTPAIDDPEHHPVDRLVGRDEDGKAIPDGYTVTLSDDNYRVVARPTDDPAEAPTVWADTLIFIAFATPPDVADPPTQGPDTFGQFKGAREAAPKPVSLGTDVLKYDWTLTRLQLFDVTDAEDKAVGGDAFLGDQKLACAWQRSRALAHDNPGGGFVELVLLSDRDSFWLDRASEKVADERVRADADLCHLDPVAEPGWAIGALAGFERDGAHLPPDPVSANPCLSRVAAVLTHTAWHQEDGTSSPLNRVISLPTGYSIEPAMLVPWDREIDLEGRSFEGHLVAPYLHWRAVDHGDEPPFFTQQRLILDLDEVQREGLLVLVLPDGDPPFAAEVGWLSVHSEDRNGPEWANPVRGPDLPTGEVAWLFSQPAANVTARICVMAPLSYPIGIAGIRGVTLSAAAAAAKWKAANDAANAARDNAAQKPAGVEDPIQRTILKVGRLYRLDIEMRWVGTLQWTDNDGHPANPEPRKDSMVRHIYFRTADKAGGRLLKLGDHKYTKWLLEDQDSFEPDMLERYLSGYEPAGGEMYRFPDDRIWAEFRQDHVPVLAQAHGYALELRTTRVDQDAPGDADPDVDFFLLAYARADKADFLNPIDRLRFEAISASTCAQPLPGLTGSAGVGLATEAWYRAEVTALRAPATATEKKPGRVVGRLPGVTFRTSRWRNAEEMLRGLGFTTAGRPGSALVGDVAVVPAALPSSTSDQAFLDTLARMGLPDWPPATAPRLSRLWTERVDANGEAVWLFAGIMIESIEPVPRPGRVALGAAGDRILRLDMGVIGDGVLFDHLEDAGGFRLLFLARNAVEIRDRDGVVRTLKPAVELVLTDSPRGAATKTLKGRMTIPLAPAFAGEP